MATHGASNIPREVRGEAARSGLTQSDLAEILGLSRMSISRRMTGRVAFSTAELKALADRFNVPVSRFFGEPALASSERGDAA